MGQCLVVFEFYLLFGWWENLGNAKGNYSKWYYLFIFGCNGAEKLKFIQTCRNYKLQWKHILKGMFGTEEGEIGKWLEYILFHPNIGLRK